MFKGNEPAQVHVYHDKYCDPALTEVQVDSLQELTSFTLWIQTAAIQVVKKK